MSTQGMTYEEAGRQAVKETASDVAWDTIGGFISGAASGAVQKPIQAAAQTEADFQSGLNQASAGFGTIEQVNPVTKQAAQAKTGVDYLVENAQGQKNNTSETETTANSMLKEADLQDYLAVGERGHVRDVKKTQVENGDSPILTTFSQIRDFIRSALKGEKPNSIKAYGKVGSRMAQDISSVSGGETNVSGYYLELDSNRLRHMKDHIATDADGRNIPLSAEQAEQLTDYIDNYDKVLDVQRKKDGGVRVYLCKSVGDGQVVIVELVSKGRESLQPVTAWQNTKETFKAAWGEKGADYTSQTGQTGSISGYQSAPTETSAAASADTNISNVAPKVNSNMQRVSSEHRASNSPMTSKNAITVYPDLEYNIAVNTRLMMTRYSASFAETRR